MAFNPLRLLLLLPLFISYAYSQVSIDCGSLQSTYTDENSIVWTNDDGYTKNGQPYSIRNSSILPVLATLRAFPTRKKNCYGITEGVSKGDRVLVRASFFYGNYDGKSSPPSFGLQFDGNEWVTVRTTPTDLVYYEVIYTAKLDGVSVCVAQTNPGQIPFVSAVEVRGLDSNMYKHVDPEYPLLLMRRVGYGAKSVVRYSDDTYDRIWNPATPGNGLTSVSSDALFINTADLDKPPSSVLQNAISALRPASSIILNLGLAANVETPAYINMYVSEVTRLDPTTQARSFQLQMDGQPLMTDPIIPPYESFEEVTSSNITISGNTMFSLVPTSGSNLPPIINAVEAFLIGNPLSQGTYPDDVNGLASLQSSFEVLQDWSGDPCLPAPYSWDWIDCSTDPTPRVTALYLSSFGLQGLLPDFSSMDALQTIDLHNNSLSGPIPDFFGTLPYLKELNLGNNELSGSVPATITKKNNLNLVVTRNPDLCTPGKSCEVNSADTPELAAGSGGGGKKSISKLPVVLGTTIPSIIIIKAVIAFLVILRQRQKRYSLNAATANTPSAGATLSRQA